MVEMCAIASGSNGNCYYVGNETDAVLIDAGISRKQVLLRMEKMGLDRSRVRAIFISHEHADHMRGVKVLSKVLNVPVYMTRRTFEKSWNPIRPGDYRFFQPNEPVIIESIIVFPFIKYHDAVEPCSFRVETHGKQVGIFTDIGEPCENLIGNFKQCHAMFLESNYDEELLWNGSYPYYLKQRVASATGHLSNRQAFQLLSAHGADHLTDVFLSHLSQENNTPEIALNAFLELHKKHKIHMTSRFDASDRIVIL